MDGTQLELVLTNKQLRLMFGALQSLGNRTMATVSADLKVGRLLRIISPFAEPIPAARQRIALNATKDVPKDMPELEQQKIVAEILEKQEDFDAETQTVAIAFSSTGPIKQADLPQRLTGDDGWKNADKIGAITADLGALFEFPE